MRADNRAMWHSISVAGLKRVSRPSVRRLLGAGYLPDEIPPVFTSEPFADFVSDGSSTAGFNDSTFPVQHNLGRPGGLRRPLSIPNPLSQAELVRQISSAWPELNRHMLRSGISCSRAVHRMSGDRALMKRHAFSEWASRRVESVPGARYAFFGDVSQFYSSIYTHSISWALEGRAAAKQRLRSSRRKSPTTGDNLDKAVRNGQGGQTKGIPIGPDTSLCLSELIMCAVDVSLQGQFPKIEDHCIRFSDDVEAYVSSRTLAEELLLAWERDVAEFELFVNPDKTGVAAGPFSIEASWRTTLSKFVLRRTTDRIRANDLQSLFSLAFDLAREHPREPIIGYVVGRISGDVKEMEPIAWRVLQDLLLAAITVEPACIRGVAARFAAAALAGLSINKALVEKVMNEFVLFHSQLRHGSEVSWALWLALILDLRLERSTVEVAMHTEDDPSLILLLALNDRGLVEQGADLSPARALAEALGAAVDRHWLLAYEAGLRRWAGRKELVAVQPMKSMLAAGVTFLDLPLPSDRAARRRLPASKAPPTSTTGADPTTDSSVRPGTKMAGKKAAVAKRPDARRPGQPRKRPQKVVSGVEPSDQDAWRLPDGDRGGEYVRP